MDGFVSRYLFNAAIQSCGHSLALPQELPPSAPDVPETFEFVRLGDFQGFKQKTASPPLQCA